MKKTKISGIAVASTALLAAGLVAGSVSPAAAGPSPSGCSLRVLNIGDYGSGQVKVKGKCGKRKVNVTEGEFSGSNAYLAGKIGKTNVESSHIRWTGHKKPLAGNIGKRKVKGNIKTTVARTSSNATVRVAGKLRYGGKTYSYSFRTKVDSLSMNYQRSTVKRGKKSVSKNNIVRAYISTVVAAEVRGVI